ncbi:heavy metal translocating P-type ATPase [Neobacillus vireti]|uniref:Cd(2+)-exporting ATPase n=1 Tax=Neobacillus vireti LMG 21834 TaxID=1131730 RepID=A0AB94IGU9_9BACI|nr:heavy metal translocating P-type ATPase [Neobacillus vireti]ETI66337.1 heavy metal translocating P-type ATPase [Neobacillus vireti LMG 21834]KLT16513.1 ATPase P [Neobacillus vireti]
MVHNVTLIHSIPGRTRLSLGVTYANGKEIEAVFRSFPYVYSASYTNETGSLLLYHDDCLTWNDLFLLLGQLFPEPEVVEKKEPMNAKIPFIEILVCFSAFMYETLKAASIPSQGLRNVTKASSLAVLLSSYNIFKNGFLSVMTTGKPNADTLTSAALLASIVKGNPKSALIIYLMSTISEWLTDFTAYKTRNYVRDMLSVKADYVWKVDHAGKEVKVSIDEITAGDQIVVFQGEKVVVDGTILEGTAVVDESSITGEYIPRELTTGEKVFAGSIVVEGSVNIRVEKAGDDTAISRMIHLIEEAQTKQAPIQSVANRLSEKLVPVSFVLAGLIFVVTRDWNKVLNMLVIDYVCGLKLSTATAISSSIGLAAKSGILIKGGQTIEKLAQIDTVILDKTGTITEGRPIVTKIITAESMSENQVLSIAASAEEHSSHPIAEAICNKAKEHNLDVPEHQEIDMIVGKGIKAIINEKLVLVGSKLFLADWNIPLEPLKKLNSEVNPEENIVYVAYDQQLIGIIILQDKIREGMKRSINQMRRHGVDEFIMLTGDRYHPAKKIVDELGMDAFIAEALPEDKANFVMNYKQKTDALMMVGDGVNDAPALAYANVGITLGTKRTDIAVETADVIVTTDDPLALAEVIKMAQKTMRLIYQNIVVTILVNSGAILLGTLGMISPVLGAAIHNAATIAVVLNSGKIIFLGGKASGN